MFGSASVPGAYGGQIKVSDSLQVGLQTTVSYHVDDWLLNPRLLEEQLVLLTMERSLQALAPGLGNAIA